jgi:hypothetical protein
MTVYFILNNLNKVKIGQTNKLYNRIKNLQTGNSSELKLIGIIKNCDKTLEKSLHFHFKDNHSNLEWFYYSGKLKRFLDVLFKNIKEFDCEKDNLIQYLNNNNFSF